MNQNSPSMCPRNEQAVGWALHSLEPDEEIAVLLHLPDCPSCRQVADDAEGVLTHLGTAVEQIDPPSSLRDRLMARVADTPQELGSAQRVAAPAEAPDPAESTEAPATPRRRDSEPVRTGPADNRPGRGSRWSRRGRQLVAGALALIAVLAIGGLAARNSQLEQQRDAQIAQTQSLENLLDQFDRPGVQHALLSREDGSTIAAVVVENGRQQVFPLGIPANAVDRDTYVLWGIAAGAPEPLGTFDVTGDAQGLLTVGSAADGGYAAYAISLEPGRTAPAVPTEVVAKGIVAA
jgi:Anti-sigma-K factor rskA